MDHKERTLRIVTPRQFKDGYYLLEGVVAHRKSWKLVGQLEDGNYVVEEPEKHVGFITPPTVGDQ